MRPCEQRQRHLVDASSRTLWAGLVMISRDKHPVSLPERACDGAAATAVAQRALSVPCRPGPRLLPVSAVGRSALRARLGSRARAHALSRAASQVRQVPRGLPPAQLERARTARWPGRRG